MCMGRKGLGRGSMPHLINLWLFYHKSVLQNEQKAINPFKSLMSKFNVLANTVRNPMVEHHKNVNLYAKICRTKARRCGLEYTNIANLIDFH